MIKISDLESDLKLTRNQNVTQERELKDFKLKQIKESKGLFVEEKDDEVNIQANSILGASQSISLK